MSDVPGSGSCGRGVIGANGLIGDMGGSGSCGIPNGRGAIAANGPIGGIGRGVGDSGGAVVATVVSRPGSESSNTEPSV